MKDSMVFLLGLTCSLVVGVWLGVFASASDVLVECAKHRRWQFNSWILTEPITVRCSMPSPAYQ